MNERKEKEKNQSIVERCFEEKKEGNDHETTYVIAHHQSWQSQRDN